MKIHYQIDEFVESCVARGLKRRPNAAMNRRCWGHIPNYK